MRCANCFYYSIGKCHRYPPVVHIREQYYDGGADKYGDFPKVSLDDWCGEYKETPITNEERGDDDPH